MPDFAPAQNTQSNVPDDAPHGGIHVARALKEAGVEHAFALCGGHTAPIIDACHEAEIRLIDHRHEGAASIAAEGYALATGKTGVAIVTAGAGFTNALTGFADAGTWSVPLVMIGGHAPMRQTGRGAVQDAPQLAIAATVAKKTLTCVNADRIHRVTQEAMYVARSGRPGPVYLELPQDVVSAKALLPDGSVPAGFPSRRSVPRPSAEDLERVVKALETAQRPVLLCGSGSFWSGAGETIARLAETANIPVITTSAARGVVADSHPMCLGSLIHAGIACASADVVVILGSAFNANICFGGSPLFQDEQTLIQVDIAGDKLGGDRRPAIAVTSDIGELCKALVDAKMKSPPGRKDWVQEAREMTHSMLASWDAQIENHSGSRLHAGAVVKRMVDFARQRFGGKVTFVADGGDALLWPMAYTYAELPGRILTTTTALGTIGVGIPFAMAAKVARPDEPVILFQGDGSFGFFSMEIESAVRQKLPIVCLVSNNTGWRDVSHEQDMWFGKGRRFASELSDARYDLLGQALGAHGENVTALDQVAPALTRAFESGKPAVLNVHTDPEVLSDLLRNLGSMGIN